MMKRDGTPDNANFWSYTAGIPTPYDPPEDSPMTREQWESLSPGMRREITRQANKEARR